MVRLKAVLWAAAWVRSPGVGGQDSVGASRESRCGERCGTGVERRGTKGGDGRCGLGWGEITVDEGYVSGGRRGEAGGELAGSVGDDRRASKSKGSGRGVAQASDGVDGGCGGELADSVVVGVCEGELVCGEDGGTGGVEGGGGGGSGVAGEALRAGAGDSGNDAGGGVDAADAVVGGVGEVEVAGGVDGQAVWEGETCGDGGGAVSGAAEGAVPAMVVMM